MVTSSVPSYPGTSPLALKDSSTGLPSAIARARVRLRPEPVAQKKLPAWPLMMLLYGFPALWALGVLQIAPIVLAAVMLFYLIIRGNVRVPGPMWVWAAFSLWVVVAALALTRSTDIIGWGLRFVNILSAGVYALYYYNARSSISLNKLLGGLATLWGTLIVLGYGGVFFPEFRLRTPMSFIMPSGFMQNPLVRDYMLPPLAEVQRPWGAPEAYVRPSAPFPYANSWGLAYTLLTPVMLACLLRLRSIWTRIALLIAMALSTVPAIATSNRGMFIGLGISAAYVLLRQFLAANWRAVGIGVAAIMAVVVALFASGTVDHILGRQDYSDSTGGRAALYQATWKATLESPIIGYGTPRMEPSIGVSMGTQGYLWTLMFCFGFVGLALFLLFILGTVVAGARVKTAAGYWLHSLPVASCVVFIFYSFDIAQLSILLLASMACLRSIREGEGL
ncbi:O-antigen ligase family protein [uncultured Rothia sp.]|uniref:O-antigen ligase family protein n=1 Tax=uncultured Rothia sp. TaxID=316088 RepID=UPI0028D0D734|nr:O-antigen ligase family protein [uncultured Rothia sp.]